MADSPLFVAVLMRLYVDLLLRRVEEQRLIEHLASAVLETPAGDPPLGPIFHLFNDRPGYCPLVFLLDADDLPTGRDDRAGQIIHRALERMDAVAADSLLLADITKLSGATTVNLEFSALSREEAMAARKTADRIYTRGAGWIDRQT
jgi:hypothetical protein